MIFELIDDIKDLLYDEIKQYYNVKKRKYSNINTINWHLLNGLNINDAIYNVAKEDNYQLITQVIRCGANNWNYAMAGAAKGEHMELVNFFIEKGADNFRECYNVTINNKIKDLLRPLIYTTAAL